MQQDRPWECRDGEHGRFLLVVAEAYRGSWLVVVFEKTYVGPERGVRGADAGYQSVAIASQQGIIELFVVGEAKAELLQASL
jgi:hypothetical protein